MNEGWEGFRLSPQQERLWSLCRTHPVFRTMATTELVGPVDVGALAASLGDLFDRHEILRTLFRPVLGDDGAALQVVADPCTPALTKIDQRGLDAAAQRQGIADHWRVERDRSFDPLVVDQVSITLFAQDADRHTLMVVAPRLFVDGGSMRRLFAELGRAYAARVAGDVATGGPLIQYADFAQWQVDVGESTTASDAIARWQRPSGQDISPLRLPLELAARDNQMALNEWTVAPETVSKLARLARRYDTTVQVVLLACWYVALWRAGGQPDRIVVDVCFDGRQFEDLRDALGCFESYGPLVLALSAASTLDDLVESLAEAFDTALAAQQVLPLALARPGARDVRRVGYSHFDWPHSIEAGPLTLGGFNMECQAEPLKLEMISQSVGNNLTVAIRHEVHGFAPGGVEALAEALREIIDAAEPMSSRLIDDLPLVGAEMARRLVIDLNPRSAASARPVCWHHAFVAQAALSPEVLAIVFEDRSLTYRALEEFTNRIARALSNRGVAKGTVVGLMLPRSDLAIAGLIAILKTGGAYMPLDPHLPRHRRDVMITESQVALVLCDETLAKDVPSGLAVLRLDADSAEIAALDSRPMDIATDEHDLAYILFTSGSTGTPKGVAVEHGQLMNYVDGAIERLDLIGLSRFAMIGTLSTDLGNTTVFPSLCIGATLQVVSADLAADAQALAEYFADNPCDVLKITPSHLSALFAGADDPGRLLPRQRLILGGEPLSWGTLRLFRSFSSGCRFFNHYGPTETCVGVLAGEADPDAFSNLASTVPLGRPMKHVCVYILDASGRPVPFGVPGELHIGGATVARIHESTRSDGRTVRRRSLERSARRAPVSRGRHSAISPQRLNRVPRSIRSAGQGAWLSGRAWRNRSGFAAARRRHGKHCNPGG